ncbi:hypothetical protein J3Q64DRAFT_1720559 [Phycomyces blakesleeanus]|uniref:Arrestin C-terminal-like domain-containing protein n=1 Tax=Phycomyces blakesleeanus TaxID=4837 RepID=A0ABR3B9J0_PHYBL
MAITSFDIVPDNDYILLHANDVPGRDMLIIRGYVTLCVSKPISLRQIRVQLKGVLKSVVNTEFTDKVTGLSKSVQVLVREQKEILGSVARLEPGVSQRWPFEIIIPDSDRLPGSLTIPNHSIVYDLSAKLILASVTELFKFGFWAAKERVSSSSSVPSPPSSSSSSSITVLPPPPQSNILSPLLDRERSNDKNKKKDHQTRPWLRARHSLEIQKHTFGYLDIPLLLDVFQKRYQGTRQGHLSYTVICPSLIVRTQDSIGFQCTLTPLKEDTQVVQIIAELEQSERYPIQPGEYKSDQTFEGNMMRTRIRKIVHMERTILPSESLENLSFSLDLDWSKISRQLSFPGLEINHQLRLQIHFSRTEMAKPMSLSFPIRVGSIPSSDQSHETAPISQMTDAADMSQSNYYNYNTEDESDSEDNSEGEGEGHEYTYEYEEGEGEEIGEQREDSVNRTRRRRIRRRKLVLHTRDESLPSYDQVLLEASPPSHTIETHVPSVRIPIPVHVEPLMGAFNNNN